MDTTPVRIFCPEGSFAAQQRDAVARRLERARAALIDLLGPDDRDGPLEVELTDVAPATGAQADGVIHELYAPESPGIGLERKLLERMLATRQVAPPSFVVDGLLAHALEQAGHAPAGERARAGLASAHARGDLPALTSLLDGPTSATRPVSAAAAASFVRFLVDRFGPERVGVFVRLAGTRPVDAALRAAFGQPGARVEKAWRATLAPSASGGASRFLRAAGPVLRPHRRALAEIVLYVLLSVAYSIGLARMQKVLVDDALIPRDAAVLARVMTVLAVAFALVSLGLLRQNYLVARVGQSVLRALRLRLFELLQRLEPAFFQARQSGDLISRVTSDLAQVDAAVSGTLVQALRIVLLLLVAGVALAAMNPRFALVVLAGTPLLFVIGRYAGPARARASLRRQQDLAAMTSTLQENLGVQPVVKALGLERYASDRFGADLDRLFGSAVRMMFLGGLTAVAASTLAIGIQLLVLGLGGWLVIGGGDTAFGGWLAAGQTDGQPFTVGSLFAFLTITASVVGAVQGISGVLQALQQASGAMDRVQELLAARPAIADAPDARPIGRLSGEIVFEDVTFGYGDQPILRDLSLTIPAGASVALVGPSGSGKSTVLNLLLRFHEPRVGRVTIDGVDLRQATLDSLRGQIGVVFQENVLLNMSVRENVRLGRLSASDEDVERAARAAEVHETIERLPEGYDTVVGERGGRLSGGQRQRLAIARAILRDPAILLLDEATSALDPAAEAAVNATLARVGAGRTTISVTHRLAEAVYADRILVLDRGRLVEQGTHAELLALGGLYARLWGEQAGMADGGVEEARLRGVPLFADLAPELLTDLARKLVVESFAPGEVVIEEGAPGDRLYVLHRGQAEVLVATDAGDQRSLGIMREGDHFGEVALLRDVPRTATIRARTALQLFSLGKQDLDAQLATAPQLRDRLEASVAARARPTRGRQAVAAAPA